jgi:hypothetical protein
MPYFTNTAFTRDYVKFQFHLPVGATLLPVILYLDDTSVDFRGNRAYKPLVVCVGNYKHRVNNSNNGKRCVGYFPKVRLSKKDAKMGGPRRAFYQEVLANIVDNIEEYKDGFYLQLPFEPAPRLFVPRLAYMCTDWPEGQQCECVYAGATLSRRNCRMCLKKRVDFGDSRCDFSFSYVNTV